MSDKAIKRKVGKRPQCNAERTALIAANLALGLNKKTAAVLGGIKQSTYYKWIYRGEALIKRISDNPSLELDESEIVYIEFVQLTEKAIATCKQKALLRIASAALGGREYEETTVTKKQLSNGTKVEEETVRTKVSIASWQADAWMLERRFPQEFGRKLQVTQTVDDKLKEHLPEDTSPDDLITQLRELLTTNPELLTKLTNNPDNPKVIEGVVESPT